MTQSTITAKFQTTIPLDVREVLQLKPRQKVSYELRPDGSAVLRPVPRLEELFGSIKLGRPAASTQAEKGAARQAMSREASGDSVR